MLIRSILFGTAALFAVGACAAPWPLRWLRRLPPLNWLTPGNTEASQGKVFCPVMHEHA